MERTTPIGLILLILAAALLLSVGGTAQAEPMAAGMTPWPDAAAAPSPAAAPDRAASTRPATLVAQACCKHCPKGKPCGDSCIARDRTCRAPPGCACGTEWSDEIRDGNR